MTPLLGEAFLISAITADSPTLIFALTASVKPLGLEAVTKFSIKKDRGTKATRSATSTRFRAKIFFNMVGVSTVMHVSLLVKLNAIGKHHKLIYFCTRCSRRN